jgi:membrane protein DedA with SNARE-associated domain
MHILSDPAILSHIKTIGYPLMLLVMILEGPLITILASFAASLGFFNIFIVFILSVAGDIIGDIILYAIGYFGGNAALYRAEKVLKVKPEIVAKMESLFFKHGKKTIFAVKSTTGLCWITFIAAGSVRMRLKDFLLASFLGGLLWSGFLVIVGYFFGYAFAKIGDYIHFAGLLIFFSAIIFYVIFTLYKKHQAKLLLAEDPTI